MYEWQAVNTSRVLEDAQDDERWSHLPEWDEDDVEASDERNQAELELST